MEEEHSPLRVSFDWLCKVVRSDVGIIYLREYDTKDEHCISFDKDVIRCIPSVEADEALLQAAKNACTLKDDQESEDITSFTLTCEDAYSFGGISFRTGKVSEGKRLKEALAAFSRVVYRELMGGFLFSNDPEMLRVEDICMNYSYDGSQPNTVSNVSFSIHRGQFTVIMGRSGCGKTTVLNIIGGMLTPTSGHVWWDKKDIAAFDRNQMTEYRRETLGFIFQNYNLIGDLTALENVNVAVSLANKSDSPKELLKKVELGQKLNAYPFQMSGGEQQRVSIARALVKRPKILLCDEPTGALDTENAKNIMILLQRIARKRNIAVVVVTHNPEFIPLADHYIEMHNGTVKTDVFQPFPFAAEDLL